jgi:dTMP kinase
MARHKGILISLEGIDGAGKTTLTKTLLDIFSARCAVAAFREPGGTKVSEQIRRLLLDCRNGDMLGSTEAFLYAASRAQVVEECVLPALEAGKIVFLDRYIDSTIAYQGYGRGLSLDFLYQLNQLCSRQLVPQLTLLLDIDPRAGQMRQQHPADRLEKQGEAFLARVRAGYLRLAAAEPRRIAVLDARQAPETLLREAREKIEQALSDKLS